ncbi:DUF6095 family protein [Winogradskyella sediminis]|uniref:DUF6095 family protein n=1 Tax=Winogradskyella sediminis TaxID=1382466 RepID=UPI000B81FC2B|nr:DUF6095 family protein [Winogradskyella sediminis]
MADNNGANQEILTKSINRLTNCLGLILLGSTLVRLALSNCEKQLYIPTLIIVFILCIATITFLFIGTNTILDGIFKKKK